MYQKALNTMTLPASYKTTKEYISDVLHFLKTYQWLYNYNNTDILVNKVLDNFPSEWLPYFKGLTTTQLNNLPTNSVSDEIPNSLKVFLNKIDSLKPSYTVKDRKTDFNISHNSELGKKKLHEIVSLAPLIQEVCSESNINFIINIGSGLGYLSHLLHDKYKFTVLGIEGKSQYVCKAYENQEKFYLKSKGNVNFVHHFITSNSVDNIKHFIKENSNDEIPLTCLIGLHACADLSIIILELCSKLEFIHSLVIMPCCYHRIELDFCDNNQEYFKHFPGSVLYKELFDEFDAYKFVKRPFLRLACQQSMDSFIKMTSEEHEQHSRNYLFRAILQDAAGNENCQVKRIKRKTGNRSGIIVNADDAFNAYLQNLQNTHKLEHTPLAKEKLEINDDRFTKSMWKKWQDHKSNCYLVEVLTGLQAAIQCICENVVLLDRVEFLKENNFHCSVEKVTDDLISPRCYALVATRQ